MYGILALFTGHPLDFSQWIFYIWSVLCLIVFIAGLRQVYKPNLLTMSTVSTIFTVDTIFGCIYCLWFTAVWFGQEDSEIPAQSNEKHVTSKDNLKAPNSGIGLAHEIKSRGSSVSSQSASEAYEFTITMVLTLIPLAIRFYFNFIIVAFEYQLLRSSKFIFDQDDIEMNLKNRNYVFQVIYKFQKWCYYFCKRYV